MGKAKDELTPKKVKTKNMWARFKKDPHKPTKEEKAQNLADHMQAVEEGIDKLVTIKEADLNAEKGKEDSNHRKLALLRTMQFHSNLMINAAAGYGEVD